MKKKILYFICAAAVLLLLAMGIGTYMTSRNLSFSEGLCLITDNGDCMLILDGSPIRLSNLTGDEDAFSELSSGDVIRVLHDGIQETYPGQAGAYRIQKLEDGEKNDLPADVIASLTEMGWLQ